MFIYSDTTKVHEDISATQLRGPIDSAPSEPTTDVPGVVRRNAATSSPTPSPRLASTTTVQRLR